MNIFKLLKDGGGMTYGHTQFRNGLHTDGWIEKGAIVRQPQVLDAVAKTQASQIESAFPEATLLVGAPACGAVLAAFVGRYLGLPLAFVNGEGDNIAWHRMNIPTSPQKIVFVDDLICTGQGTATMLEFCTQQGHSVLGVSAWMSRVKLSVPLLTLADMPFQTYTAAHCPLCEQQMPLIGKDVRE